MRPIALNRNNSLFAGHDQGAQNWACLSSLVETCLCRVRHKQVYAARWAMPNGFGEALQTSGFSRSWAVFVLIPFGIVWRFTALPKMRVSGRWAENG